MCILHPPPPPPPRLLTHSHPEPPRLTHSERDEDGDAVAVDGQQLEEGVALSVATPPQQQPEQRGYQPGVGTHHTAQKRHLSEVKLPMLTVPAVCVYTQV